MMLGFDCKPIRERDADGRLTAAGLQWTEQRCLAFGVPIQVGTWALLGGIAALHAGASGPGWTMLGLTACTTAFIRLVPGRTRALIFHDDGRTSAPFGFAHHPRRYREVSGTNANVASIEARGQGSDPHYVAMYSRSGEVAYVAGRLEADNAHKVAVQLTLALAELRESMAGSVRPANARTFASVID